jgi:hypothetical protein
LPTVATGRLTGGTVEPALNRPVAASAGAAMTSAARIAARPRDRPERAAGELSGCKQVAAMPIEQRRELVDGDAVRRAGGEHGRVPAAARSER